jgi:hypothetical protein
MLNIFWPMLSALWPLAAGVVGWFAVNFVGKPYLEFQSLRKEIHEELIFWSETYPPSREDLDEDGNPYYPSQEEYNEAMKEYSDDLRSILSSIRRLGSKLSALNVSLNRPLSNYLRSRYKVQDAAEGLLRLSIAFDRDDRIHMRHLIEGLLRLPYSPQKTLQEVLRQISGKEEAREARRKAAISPPS